MKDTHCTLDTTQDVMLFLPLPGLVCCRRGQTPIAFKARELYTRAADMGDLGGVCGLAYMHLGGLGGCPVDPAKARAMYDSVAKAGDPRGSAGLGWYYIACVPSASPTFCSCCARTAAF